MMGGKADLSSDWWVFPEWLTLGQACYLSGYDVETMLEIIAAEGVALRASDGLIEKQSLWNWEAACAELAHWDG
jgi:hypothetical protein